MVRIRFRTPAVLAVLALTATVARSNDVTLQNGLPVGLIMEEGTTFVLKWDWDGGVSATGVLQLYSFDTNNTNSLEVDTLENKLNLTTGHYPWVVTTEKGRKTLDWYYSLGISWGTSSVSGRSFQIKAKDDPSATTSSTASTSTTNTGIIGSETSTPNTSPQPQTTSSSTSGLSGGAIAGIAIGALAGIGIFATLIGLVVYYRRKSQRGKRKETASESGSDVDKDKKEAVEAQYLKPELEAAEAERACYELDGSHQIQPPLMELDSNARSELGSDTTTLNTSEPKEHTEAST
ncbi:hypothetical protein GGR51DRAFT_333957 [Nemania sp. FL0031]|nr:hypothetical protein GGR51DRAFT_333957 [Nemania sp. FL0031]